MSRKLKIILGALVLVAAFLVIRVGSSFYKSAKTAALISQTVITPAPEENFLTKDSDGDGLSDRDEIIYGTDPYNKDTDGDGYWDGEEIATGYDPLDPTSNSQTGTKAFRPLSQTANLTDRLLDLSVANLINDSGEIDPSQMDQTKLADIMQSINNEATVALIIPPTTDADIKIIDDNSTVNITKYLNTMTGTIEEGILYSSSTIPKSINESINVSPEYSAYYQNIYESLKIVEVPSSWKEIHKSVLTIFLQLATSFKNMGNMQEDPVKASFALNQVQSSFLSLTDIFSPIVQLADKQDIPVDSIAQMLQSISSSLQSPQ